MESENRMEDFQNTANQALLEDLDIDLNEADTTPSLQGEENMQQNLQSTKEQKLDESEADEALFAIKYNGEEKSLPLQEILTLAQKGMNYDKIYKRVNEAEGTPELEALDEMASSAGVGRAEFLNKLKQASKQADTESLMQEKGLGADVASELLHLRCQSKEAQRQGQALLDQRQQEGFVTLAQKYPEVHELPESVSLMIDQGVPPIYAYESYQNEGLKAQLAALLADVNNRKSAPGSASGVGDGQVKDAFLLGFENAGR